MLAPFADVCCASLPPQSLAALAEVRAVPGVMVLCDCKRTWVRWQSGDERVLKCVLPIPGIALYSFRNGRWYRLGSHLPAFEVVAEGDFQPLHQILFPAPVKPIAPQSGPWSKITLSLRPDARPRLTTAMICTLQELSHWMDTVPSCRLKALQGARNGEYIFILGPRLPLLPSSRRMWGNTILKPLGFCLEPDLPELVVAECLSLMEGNRLIVTERQADVLSASDLRPLNRAGLRMAMRETTP